MKNRFLTVCAEIEHVGRLRVPFEPTYKPEPVAGYAGLGGSD